MDEYNYADRLQLMADLQNEYNYADVEEDEYDAYLR